MGAVPRAFLSKLSICNLRVLEFVSLGTQPTSVGTGCDLRIQTLKWDFEDASSSSEGWSLVGNEAYGCGEMLKLSLVKIWARALVEENTFVRAFVPTRNNNIRYHRHLGEIIIIMDYGI